MPKRFVIRERARHNPKRRFIKYLDGMDPDGFYQCAPSAQSAEHFKTGEEARKYIEANYGTWGHDWLEVLEVEV